MSDETKLLGRNRELRALAAAAAVLGVPARRKPEFRIEPPTGPTALKLGAPMGFRETLAQALDARLRMGRRGGKTRARRRKQ